MGLLSVARFAGFVPAVQVCILRFVQAAVKGSDCGKIMENIPQA
jgi:hypothetical protein